jgi:8-oxo-dGTP pyrophosphatase MutT (NUDIX family)
MTLAERLRVKFEATADLPPLVSQDSSIDGDHRGTPAAVLAAVVDRPTPTMLLTRRHENMRRHAGQVAFPGGRADPEDDGPVATALREANEEVGLPGEAVTLIGADEVYRTVTGYTVVPVIGVIPPDLPLAPQEAEVAEIFEVPLPFLLDPINRLEREIEWQGAMRRYFEFLYERHRIWGATAAMIVNLARRIGDG